MATGGGKYNIYRRQGAVGDLQINNLQVFFKGLFKAFPRISANFRGRLRAGIYDAQLFQFNLALHNPQLYKPRLQGKLRYGAVIKMCAARRDFFSSFLSLTSLSVVLNVEL